MHARIGAAADEDRRRAAPDQPAPRARAPRRCRVPARRASPHCARCAPPARHRLRWRWRGWRGSASIHSIEMEPEPAPISHKSSPLRGASADSVTARMSRLVICPSCSNQSSGRPGVSGMTRAPRRSASFRQPPYSAARCRRGRNPRRDVARMRSRGPPRCSSTCRRDSPMPQLRQDARRRGRRRLVPRENDEIAAPAADAA